ncbi:hypothetical protein [Stenotrophomonas phage RAS14]
MACDNEIKVQSILWEDCVAANSRKMTVVEYLKDNHRYLRDGNYKHVDFYANREVLPVVIKKVVHYLDALLG